MPKKSRAGNWITRFVDMLAWFVKIGLSLQAVVDRATLDHGLAVTMILSGVAAAGQYSIVPEHEDLGVA